MRRQTVWILLLIAYAAGIFALSSLSQPTGGRGLPVAHADKLIHAVEFAVFAFLAWKATGGRTLPALLIAVGFAISDEIHQLFVPLRHASIGDLAADAVGILLMLGSLRVLRPVLLRRKTARILDSTSAKPGD